MALSALASIPYIHIPALGPIQPFGVLVAIGVLIGAHLLRKYGEWHGIHDDHIRGVTMWVIVSGFLGAHIFDVVAYQWDDLIADPVLLFKIWAGISSYGGFLGGAMGFALYVWWKRLPAFLYADTVMVGLLPAFTIGRIGCSIVGDHMGKASDFFLAQQWPSAINKAGDPIGYVTRHNLGIYELLYLIPVCAIALGLAFRKSKRMPAGFVAVLIGAMYAPVRFFLDYLRPTTTDPRYFSLTFAQWSSILAFSASVYVAIKVLRSGKPAPIGEAAVARPDAAKVFKEALEPEKKAPAKTSGKDGAKN
jgi:phosphatidylglycerol:prolipoprotein diacylglycerol transferase